MLPASSALSWSRQAVKPKRMEASKTKKDANVKTRLDGEDIVRSSKQRILFSFTA
jgi:hypothetical protein